MPHPTGDVPAACGSGATGIARIRGNAPRMAATDRRQKQQTAECGPTTQIHLEGILSRSLDKSVACETRKPRVSIYRTSAASNFTDSSDLSESVEFDRAETRLCSHLIGKHCRSRPRCERSAHLCESRQLCSNKWTMAHRITGNLRKIFRTD